jgi:integrase
VHRVSRNLYLNVEERGSKQWLFRYFRDGEDRWVGLGSFDLNQLGAARDLVIDCRRLVRDGKDPREHASLAGRSRRGPRPKTESAAEVTFESEAEEYVRTHEGGWRGENTAPDWRRLLRLYINPVIGDKHPSAITTELVLQIVQPLWKTKNDTAKRAARVAENVLDATKVKGLRDGDKPARWKGHLSKLLPKSKHKAKPMKALDWREMPQCIVKLREQYRKEQGRSTYSHMAGVLPLLLEWSFLMGVRPSEARKRTHEEITVDKTTGLTVLKIPIEVMKFDTPVDPKDPFHTVPLTPRLIEIREEMARRFGRTGYIFKGARPGKTVNRDSLGQLLRRMGVKADVDPHGFRSTMRSWGAVHDPPIEWDVLEMILAHAVGTKVTRAYNRETQLMKRKNVMERWERYCLSGLDLAPQEPDTILPAAAE